MGKRKLLLTEKGSTRAWRKQRLRVLERDKYKCKLCGGDATHVDHIQRRRDGGTDAMKNLRATCQSCNLYRN